MNRTNRHFTGALDPGLARAGPLWQLPPADADAYFGKLLRDAKPSTRAGRAR